MNGATAGFGTVAGGTFSFDDPNWTADSTGATATTPFPAGQFPDFIAGTAGTSTVAGDSYTVTVNSAESVAGLKLGLAYQTLTLADGGSGNLTLTTGAQGLINSAGATLNVNVPIGGVAGSILQPSGGGNIYLNRANTFSGGYNVNSTATVIHFNNGSAFGTGRISFNVAGLAPFLGGAGGTTTVPAPITIANNFVNAIAGGGVNFGSDANTPITLTGTFTLGTFGLVMRNNGGSTSPLTLNGAITGSGTAGVTFSSNNATGLITLNTIEGYPGPTTIGVTGSANVKLRLAVAGAIASSSSVVFAGGALDPDAINQLMSATTAGLTASSSIDYSVGASEVDFANSSGVAWTAGAKLNLVGFDPSVDKLRFGTDATGLTAAQLAQITVGGAPATASLDGNGYVVVPEPASLALAGLATLVVGRRRRVTA